ncbi:omega-hydroxypalmitate O-feruloyl transferase-like, partial [Thalictrum thalictroides]
VTSFKCGGFAMGYSANHMLSDGIGLRIFFENVASLLAGKPLPFPPYNNRRDLAARTPPRVEFSHRELTKVSIPERDKTIYMKIFQIMDENLDNKIFHLSSDNILKLKKEAKMSNVEGTDIITSFNVVMAHLWRCRGLSENDPEKKTSTILYAVDLRSRLQPPLPLSYAGNAIISAYATASISELKEKPLGYLVQLISQGTKRITNEYARSHIDWLELHTGFPHGDFYVSPWWKIGLADVDYPWGRPKYCTPVLHFRKLLVLLLPNSDGLNVLVSLPHDEMGKFQDLFRRLDSFHISQSRL